MNNEPVHPESEIQELLDGRLSAERGAQIEKHLAECEQCRRQRDALVFARESLRASLPASPAPADVVTGVEMALDREERQTGSPGSVKPVVARRRLGRAAIAAGLAAALALAFVLLRHEGSLPSAAARDFARVRSGRLALAFPTENAGELGSYFVRERLPFRTRVFDLAMMGYRLEGGRVHSLAGRQSALFVYRGADGQLLVCEMYEGTTKDLPRALETRQHNGFDFHIYKQGNRTIVFWQEGSVTCVLVGDGGPEQVIQLAFAKAMKAS